MADILTKTQRSRCMRAIRGRNTKPEILLRQALWHKGYRYRLKNRLPGRPDIVFPTERVAVFADGCFWHGCPAHYQQPATNASFWREKIGKNRQRDKEVNALLKSQGWKVLRFWEHELKSNAEACARQVIKTLKARRAPGG